MFYLPLFTRPQKKLKKLPAHRLKAAARSIKVLTTAGGGQVPASSKAFSLAPIEKLAMEILQLVRLLSGRCAKPTRFVGMEVSVEAIVAIIGLVLALPSAALAIWTWRQYRAVRSDSRYRCVCSDQRHQGYNGNLCSSPAWILTGAADAELTWTARHIRKRVNLINF